MRMFGSKESQYALARVDIALVHEMAGTMMVSAKAERWRQVSELFDRVVDMTPAQRERILAAECAEDPTLRAEVERLLLADKKTNPLDQDIAAQASLLLLEGDPKEHYGQQFGPYRIVRLIGHGGMGRVYLAKREGDDFTQTVALKLVGGKVGFDAQLARRRFVEERRILARLEHPHIARLLDGGVGPQAQPWFAMEYVDGAPLTKYCDAQRLDIPARLILFAKICSAVDHAHRFLIVHRDLKPGNLLVDTHGEPKVLDFGIAKLLDDDGRSGDEESTILMTPDYAAPEQIRGGQISTATDVYSLGAVLFELLTGRRPFPDALSGREPPMASRAITENSAATTQSAANRGATPHALRRLLQGDLDRVVRTALDPDPARRYRSAARLADDLRAVAAGEPISLRNDTAYRVGIFLKRHKLGVAAASVAILALLATTGWALWQTQQAAERAVEAIKQTDLAKKEALASASVSDLLVSAFDAADPERRSSEKEPTARDVLDASAASVATELAESPEVRARMRMALGRAYLNLGVFDRAVELLEASRKEFLSKPVNLPVQAADATEILAMTENNRHRHTRAIELNRQVLALRKHANATDDDIRASYNNLGIALMTPGNYEEASRAFKAAYTLELKLHGTPSDGIVRSLRNQGALASMSGNLRQGERFLREAIAMIARLNDTTSSLYRTRSWLGLVLAEQGRFAEAEALLLENVRVAPVLYPGNNSNIAVAHERLASVYKHKGDLVRAQAGYGRAIALYLLAEGPASTNAALQRLELGEVLAERGDLTGATWNYQLSEEALKDSRPPDDPEMLPIVARHEGFRVLHGIQGGSRERLELVLPQWIATYGPSRKPMPAGLAEALFLAVQYRIAKGRLDGIESLLPPYDPTAEQPLLQARRHQWLARVQAIRGHRDAALTEIEQAIGMFEAQAGSGSAITALWRLDHAEWLLSAGMREKAATELALAAPVLRAQMAPKANALDRLRQLSRAIDHQR